MFRDRSLNALTVVNTALTICRIGDAFSLMYWLMSFH